MHNLLGLFHRKNAVDAISVKGLYMGKTWRNLPKGAAKEPRPPEKGGHRNYYKEEFLTELWEDNLEMQREDIWSEEDFLPLKEEKE